MQATKQAPSVSFLLGFGLLQVCRSLHAPQIKLGDLQQAKDVSNNEVTYGEVPADIHSSSGRPFACLHNSLRRFHLQFLLDGSSFAPAQILR
jgi:hypothetical protein